MKLEKVNFDVWVCKENAMENLRRAKEGLKKDVRKYFTLVLPDGDYRSNCGNEIIGEIWKLIDARFGK